jgi:hypothetical protein
MGPSQMKPIVSIASCDRRQMFYAKCCFGVPLYKKRPSLGSRNETAGPISPDRTLNRIL